MQNAFFFDFSLENIWSCQKKAVSLQAFSRERFLVRLYTRNKNKGTEARERGIFKLNKNKFKTTKCLQFNN